MSVISKYLDEYEDDSEPKATTKQCKNWLEWSLEKKLNTAKLGHRAIFYTRRVFVDGGIDVGLIERTSVAYC